MAHTKHHSIGPGPWQEDSTCECKATCIPLSGLHRTFGPQARAPACCPACTNPFLPRRPATTRTARSEVQSVAVRANSPPVPLHHSASAVCSTCSGLHLTCRGVLTSHSVVKSLVMARPVMPLGHRTSSFSSSYSVVRSVAGRSEAWEPVCTMSCFLTSLYRLSCVTTRRVPSATPAAPSTKHAATCNAGNGDEMSRD